MLFQWLNIYSSKCLVYETFYFEGENDENHDLDEKCQFRHELLALLLGCQLPEIIKPYFAKL